MDSMAAVYGGSYNSNYGRYQVLNCKNSRRSNSILFLITGELQYTNFDAKRYIHHRWNSFHADTTPIRRYCNMK